MDREFSAEENRVRSDVQAFLQSSLPATISNKARNQYNKSVAGPRLLISRS
jgi:hypothetical protein